ncbi:hypothetical protein AB0F91_31810 [Amycolatopsis sp. NPDC023774]|uniref:hypothetical protein n=1 Tax=Amycolatopsis sp. NPDC023774 TaxID=3155015 RepID=UPI00340B499C
MRSAHISRRQAEAAFDGTDEFDVLAVQDAAARASDRRDLEDAAEELELYLAATEVAAMHDFLHDFRDQRGAGRRQRRAGRTVLRSLPVRAQATRAIEDEAA